jgi:hypothetical protein
VRWLLFPELAFVADKLNEVGGAAEAHVVSASLSGKGHQADTTGET